MTWDERMARMHSEEGLTNHSSLVSLGHNIQCTSETNRAGSLLKFILFMSH